MPFMYVWVKCGQNSLNQPVFTMAAASLAACQLRPLDCLVLLCPELEQLDAGAKLGELHLYDRGIVENPATPACDCAAAPRQPKLAFDSHLPAVGRRPGGMEIIRTLAKPDLVPRLAFAVERCARRQANVVGEGLVLLAIRHVCHRQHGDTGEVQMR